MSGEDFSRSLWQPKAARRLSGPELCAYASRLVGADPRLVLWGGGNSSVKGQSVDYRGSSVRTIWVKASGFDMKTIGPEGLTALRLDELLRLRERREMSDEEMVAYIHRCQLDPQAARPSIETLLHAFVPARHVYHTHADAVAGFTCTPGSERRTRDAFGGKVLWVPYVRPGFQLSKWVIEAVEKRPDSGTMILDKHGALTWGDDARAAYEAMVELTQAALRYQKRKARRAAPARAQVSSASARETAAAVMPWLRGAASARRRVIVRWDGAPEVLRFLSRRDAESITQRGPFSPDHTLQTKARPLFWTPAGRAGLSRAMEGYRAWYERYFKAHAPKGTPELDPYPRVVLVPGAGLFTTGRDRRQAGVARDIYRHTIEVLERVSAFARYTPLDLRHLGDLEFWPLETYKYKLLPAEREFARKVVLVTGAAGAIGAATAEAFCRAGASVVLGDVNMGKAKELEARLNTSHGEGCAFAVRLDVARESDVDAAFEEAILHYGGLDVVFSNAGVAKAEGLGSLELRDWLRNVDVNATGAFLIFRAALRHFKEQGIGGAVVLNATKNVLAPGKDFGAYSASKAAAVQLARVLALEGADYGVRVNIVNPDAVFEGSGLWSAEVRRQRAKAQGIAVGELEAFYAKRNLLGARVRAADVAEAVMFLASERSSKTTGGMLAVDGGLREAFAR